MYACINPLAPRAQEPLGEGGAEGSKSCALQNGELGSGEGGSHWSTVELAEEKGESWVSQDTWK